MRGNFFAGSPNESCSDFGSSRGFRPFRVKFPLAANQQRASHLYQFFFAKFSGARRHQPSATRSVSLTVNLQAFFSALDAMSSYTVIVALGTKHD
jgi:hypothetical protein